MMAWGRCGNWIATVGECRYAGGMQYKPLDFLDAIQEECGESTHPSFSIPCENGCRARYSTERIGNTVFVEDMETGMFFKVVADAAIRDEWKVLRGDKKLTIHGVEILWSPFGIGEVWP